MTSHDEEKTLQEELALPILLADRVIKLSQEAESSKLECSELARQVDSLSHMLRSIVRLTSTTQSLYERPIRRVVADVTKNIDRALTLVRKFKKSTIVLRQIFAITTTGDFRKVSNLIDSSMGDVKWLLSIFDSEEGPNNISMPPIASNDPILSWVWSNTATVQMGQLKYRADAANQLASLASDNDRNKKIIIEEGGIVPLLKLLKEATLPDAQIAAANALHNIATDIERVRVVVDLLGIPIIVQVLSDAPMRVQILIAKLVSRMAELDPIAQEEFLRENVTRPLVSLLSMDIVLDDSKLQNGKPSIHSLVQINKDLTGKSSVRIQSNSNLSSRTDSGIRGGQYRKEREAESSEMKNKIKVSCAEALWRLSKGSLPNSKKITETKGLICLAKIIEVEKGELQLNCLRTITEVAAVAESNVDLRRAAFKTNSLAARAVLDQLLRVIQEEEKPLLRILAIKAIGSLARTFPARETRIIGPLVAQLGNQNVEVATEAAISLGKFTCPENFNCVEHSKAIIEFEGIPPLMRLLRTNDHAQIHGLELLCYLALCAGNSKALEQTRALTALELAARSVVTQRPELKELFAKAIHHLTLYQTGHHPHRQPHAP